MLNERQSVLSRLAAADRRHQKEAGGRLLLRGVGYACVVVLAAFVADVALHLGAGWRLGLLLAMLGAAAALLAVAWRVAFVRRNRLERVARFLEGRAPALGSRLINLLQLQDQIADASLEPFTRRLAAQAVEGYAAELSGTPLEGLARTGELRRQAKRAALSLLGFAAVLAMFFRVAVVEAARFGDPFGDHPPYSFTRLEITEPGSAGAKVLYGKGVAIKVKATGHQPRELFLTAFPPGHPEQGTTVAMFDKGSGGFQQLVEPVRSELLVVAHTKDRTSLSKAVRLRVVLTPQLEAAFVQVTPPAYTGLKAEEKPYAFKGVQALEGSDVRFRLLSNRPLRDGRLALTSGELPPQEVLLKKGADNEVAGAFVAAESGRLRFSLNDLAGLPSQADLEGALTVTHDLPPEIAIVEPARDALVALDLKFQAQFEASDDYGLRSVRIHRGVNGVYPAPKVILYAGIERNRHETLDVDLAEMGVKAGDVISLFAEALDTAPQPHRARSQTVRLSVISVEDYNNYLREQNDLRDTEGKYAALTDDLQELVEQQNKLGDLAEQLAGEAAKAKPGQSDEMASRLDALIERQNELNDKLNQQAQRMEHFVRDNPVYDVERDLQESLRQQAGQVRQSTAENEAAARKLAQRSAGGGQGSAAMASDFKKASDKQVARLGGAQEKAATDVAQTLEDMSLMQELQKDFNQFQALQGAQKELAAQTQAYNRAGQLGREDQLALKELAGGEKRVGEALDQVEQKLRRDASAAGKLFPKAARSGQDLADKMAELRFASLARQATSEMLAANGDRSFRLAERLRDEMEKLFTDAQSGQSGHCPSCEELDSYLRLNRGLKPGNNFAQMGRSRKSGLKPGRGQGQGQGEGDSGFAMADGSKEEVMGNEPQPQRGSANARQSSRQGVGLGVAALDKAVTQTDQAEVLKGLKLVNRQSGAVSSETPIEEYSDLVDHYFKTITTGKSP
ncbi:MAG TPA: hypothetical protein VN829_19395 [Dongiaceae bacterium]|nr:hypothetical protein [Dongiaceae bacterium]